MVAMGWSWASATRTNRLLMAATVVVVIGVVSAEGTWLFGLLPDKRGASQLRNAVPLDEEYAYINRVSHWPADWINAVCEPPLYRLRNYKRLPHAIANASCRSLIKPDGDLAPNLMISRFSSELPMQIDLHNEGYNWYAFAYDRGSLVSFETVSDAAAIGTNGFNESLVLQPLKQFGFNIYSGPGPP